MRNEKEDSKKVLIGLLIGGAIGVGAMYCMQAAHHEEKTPVLKKIGQTISDVGQMLEGCSVDSGSQMLEKIESKIPKGADVVSSLVDWVDTGMTLWKKFKKG